MKCENYVKFNFQYPVKTSLTETQSRPFVYAWSTVCFWATAATLWQGLKVQTLKYSLSGPLRKFNQHCGRHNDEQKKYVCQYAQHCLSAAQ